MTIITQQTGQFSGYSLDELRALVLKMLRATNTSRYSPTLASDDYDWIDDSLNRGQEEFVRKTRCIRTMAIIELKANYRVYRLPWNFIDLMSAYFYNDELSDGYKELTPTTIEELNTSVAGWRTERGEPTHIYMDRLYGNNWTVGLYPTPSTDGDEPVLVSDYGMAGQFVCPFFTYNSEYGIIIRMAGTDEYWFNMNEGVVGDVESVNNNVVLEYYRLPAKLIEVTDETLGDPGVQYAEIPREYHKALIYYAAYDLLQNNPEDSVEYKRGASFLQRFNAETEAYIDNRKRPLAGQNLRAMPVVWTQLANIPYLRDQV